MLESPDAGAQSDWDIVNTELLSVLILKTTCTASRDTAQLLNIYIRVKAGMRDEQVHGKAQRAACAAQSSDIVQGLIKLPNILL